MSTALEAATSALTVAFQACLMYQCNRLAERVRSFATAPGGSPVLSAWALSQLGLQRFTHADYDGAMACFDAVWAIAQANALESVLSLALMHRFMLEFRMRGPAAAEAAMRHLEALPAPRHPHSRGLLTCYRARLAQVRGETRLAAELAECSQADIVRTGAGFQESIYGLMNAEILLDAGRADRARVLIVRSGALIERADRLRCG